MASKKKVNSKKAQKKKDQESGKKFEKMCSTMDDLGDMLCQTMQLPDTGLDKYNNMEKEILSMVDNDNKDIRDKKAEALDKITEEKEIRRKAEMQMQKKMMEVMNGKFKNTVYLDDGDQTPLKGNARRILQYQWALGMDYNPLNHRFSNWLRVIFNGDYSAMMKIVENTRKEDIQRLIEKRESLLNIGAIFHVINGAKMLNGDSEEHAELRKMLNNGENDHMACFLKLIELGVNINAKDVAGFTPLHHCVTKFVNSKTMKMAKILLKNGANVNEQNRFGSTPLMEPTLMGKLQVLEMLVKHGADPGIPDNDGKNCLNIHPFVYPKINEIFGKASHNFAKAKRKEAIEESGGSLRKCVGCGSMDKDNKRCGCSDKDNKRCTGCYLVWYCQRPCQQKHWKNHKKPCKETQLKFVPVIIQREKETATKNWKTGQVYVTRDSDVPSSSHFLVKVQVPQEVDCTKAPLYLYNKDRSLLGEIPKEDSSYDQLVTIVKERGPMGCKGFFYAIWSDSGLKINVTDIQTPQTW